MIITLKGADFSASNIGTLNTWRITRSLGTGATYEGVTSVNKGASFTATVTIAEGYELGTAGVTVTMGGTVISVATVNENVITISIAEVTGNVVIKVPTVNIATGEEEEPEVPELPSTLTLYKTVGDNGLFIMNYQGTFSIAANNSSTTGKFQMIGVDVSNYVGKTLKITSTQYVIDGAMYSFFTNALAGGFALEDLSTINSDNLTEQGEYNDRTVLDTSIILDEFVVSTTTQQTNTIQKVVPAGAEYLYFTNLTMNQTSEPSVVVM